MTLCFLVGAFVIFTGLARVREICASLLEATAAALVEVVAAALVVKELSSREVDGVSGM